jgi:hypothetical protein
MNTDDLLDRLAAEAGPAGPSPARRAVVALAAGLIPSLILYLLALHPRADLALAIATPRVEFKLTAALVAALAAAALLPPLLAPTGRLGARRWLPWLVGGLVALGVVTELAVIPASAWLPSLVGHNALFCLTMLPSLALGPFVALMLAARHGAPMRPSRTGAGIGFLSASVAAVLYATHCPDDSPLFLATWYGIAILAMTGLGAGVGRRVLRW